MTTPYLPHLYDPTRRTIATRYLQHELRKLFPHQRDEPIWNVLDEDVRGWFDNNSTLSPVRDFWNGLHGVSMGFKLKNIVSWLTSAHIQWQEEVTLVDNLSFGATLDDLKPVGAAPSACAVREWYFLSEHQNQLLQAEARDQQHGSESSPHDDDPIFVVRREGVLRVVDGNRRLLKAILHQRKTISATVGEPIANPSIYEQWVPTSTLIDLVSFHRYASQLDRDTTKASACIIAELIRTSSAGRFEFLNRSLSERYEADKRLLESVRELLARESIQLR